MSDKIIAETRTIEAPAPGTRLQLINRRPAELGQFSAASTLLMMHGATFPSASLFDVTVDGASFIDLLAAAGLDVWAVDVTGYGGSSRPPAMSRPPEGAAPLVPAREAVADLRAAVDFICRHRGVERVQLLGMSWGASVAALLAVERPDLVERLVLVTPLWLSRTPLRTDRGGPLGAYRAVDPRAYGSAWRDAAPECARAALIPEGWFDAWVWATIATDPGSPVAGTIRAPSGAVQDVREHWTVGAPLYDPAAIRCPALVVAAEWDVDVRPEMARDLFDRLTGAASRRMVEIGRATHMVVMEPARTELSDAVVAFLLGRDEADFLLI